jgi:hypothetical protein
MGSFFSPGSKDMNIYGMQQGQRGGLASSAGNQLQGMYNTDPNSFWGGKNAWTTTGDVQPPGGMSWGALTGGGGGGHASAGHATASLAKVAMGLDDPTYAIDMPKNEEERLLQKANEEGSAQAGDSWRRMQDSLAQSGGGSTSPAAMALQGQIERQRLAGSANTLRDTRSSWNEQSRGLRNSWNQLATGVNVSNASNLTNVSMGNASNDTQASIANGGFASAAAGRSAAAAQFLLGARGADEDRSIQRYTALNGMNMGWQAPNAQKTMTPSGFSNLMGGLGSAASLAGGFKSLGMFGGNQEDQGGGQSSAGGYYGNSGYVPYSGGQGGWRVH